MQLNVVATYSKDVEILMEKLDGKTRFLKKQNATKSRLMLELTMLICVLLSRLLWKCYKKTKSVESSPIFLLP